MSNNIRISTVALIIATAFVLGFAGGSATAQTAQRVLNQRDVDKFIKDFKAMNDELEQVDTRLIRDDEDMPDLQNMATAMRSNAQAQSIVRKYGWDDRFVDKYVAIMGGFIVVTFSDMRARMMQELSPQLAAVDANTGLTAEQREQMKASMTAWMPPIEMAIEKYRAQVHAGDQQLIEANKDALMELFE